MIIHRSVFPRNASQLVMSSSFMRGHSESAEGEMKNSKRGVGFFALAATYSVAAAIRSAVESLSRVKELERSATRRTSGCVSNAFIECSNRIAARHTQSHKGSEASQPDCIGKTTFNLDMNILGMKKTRRKNFSSEFFERTDHIRYLRTSGLSGERGKSFTIWPSSIKHPSQVERPSNAHP